MMVIVSCVSAAYYRRNAFQNNDMPVEYDELESYNDGRHQRIVERVVG